MTSSAVSAADLRAQLDHPILDCDGHWIESRALVTDYLDAVAGGAAADKFRALNLERGNMRGVGVEPTVRQERRIPHQLGAANSGTRDVATAMLPALMYERLGELGIDFSIIYPSLGMGFLTISDDDLRNGLVRAYNTMAAESYSPYGDRFAPVAIIAVQTPDEAISQLEHAVSQLGLKAIMIIGALPRPIPASSVGPFKGSFVDDSWRTPYYIDPIGLDDPAGYDPFWKRCVELGVAVTSHGGSTDWVDRRSITNNMYNHIGHFAQANHAFAKAVFLSGVTRRFPTLNFGFMEGGVTYGLSLLWDLMGHWEKFNIPSLLEHYNPTNTNLAEMRRLLETYAKGKALNHIDEVLHGFTGRELRSADFWGASGVHSKKDIRENFVRNFYFGCEADDPGTALAFDPKNRAPLKPIFSSDLSHPDVPVMTDVLPEVFEMLDHNLLNHSQFKQFVFSNAVALHGGMNPDFFRGTAIEAAAAEQLAAGVRQSVNA